MPLFFLFFSLIIAWNGFSQFFFFKIFGIKRPDFCLVVRGLYPPYTLSGPITKKKLFFMCVFSNSFWPFFIREKKVVLPLKKIFPCWPWLFRDFFLNLDNLHDYLKYTFPRMKAPSFFIERKDLRQMTPPSSLMTPTQGGYKRDGEDSSILCYDNKITFFTLFSLNHMPERIPW